MSSVRIKLPLNLAFASQLRHLLWKNESLRSSFCLLRIKFDQ